ncbi:DUF4330 domain-containing protein, partial [Dysosmobacter welbionis]
SNPGRGQQAEHYGGDGRQPLRRPGPDQGNQAHQNPAGRRRQPPGRSPQPLAQQGESAIQKQAGQRQCQHPAQGHLLPGEGPQQHICRDTHQYGHPAEAQHLQGRHHPGGDLEGPGPLPNAGLQVLPGSQQGEGGIEQGRKQEQGRCQRAGGTGHKKRRQQAQGPDQQG